jgi:hypothetical protein
MKLDDLQRLLDDADDEFDPYDFAMVYGKKLLAVAKAAYVIKVAIGQDPHVISYCGDAFDDLENTLQDLEKDDK